MNYQIISESVSNIYKIKNIPYTCISSSIDTVSTRYIDHQGLNVDLMMEQLYSYYGEANILPPSVEDWYNAFKEVDYTFILPNTALLSESYHNALKAKEKYNALYPNKKIYVLNTNATGPALGLVIEKLVEIIEKNKDIEQVLEQIQTYIEKIHFVVSYKKTSSNLKLLVDKFTSFLGLSTISTLKSKKICFSNKTFEKLIHTIKDSGFNGNKLVIAHSNTKESIETFIQMLKEAFGSIEIDVIKNSGINAYYYGKDAILVGYEK